MIVIKLVFKQWINPPNKQSSKIKTKKMLIYIATRDGVAYNQNQDFGLIGKFNNMKEIGEIKSLDKARRCIYNMAKEKKTIFNAVISIKDEDAIKKEIDNLSQKIIKENPQIKKEYDNYIKNIQEYTEITAGSKKIDYYVEKAKQDINKKISNKILAKIKDLKLDINEKNKLQFIRNKNPDLLQSILDDICYCCGQTSSNIGNSKSDTEMNDLLAAELERKNQDRRNM